MNMIRSAFFASTCRRLGSVFLYLLFIVNCFLAYKPSNILQPKTVRNVQMYITVGLHDDA